MGGAALRRTESRAGGNSGHSASVDMVECRCPLRPGDPGPDAVHGAVEAALDGGTMAELSWRDRIWRGVERAAALNPYRAAAGESGICRRARAFHIASAGSRQGRPAKETVPRSAPAQLHLSGVETGERPVCPRFSPRFSRPAQAPAVECSRNAVVARVTVKAL